MIRKIFGTQNERELKRIWPLVEKINALEPSIVQLDNAALQAKTAEFKTSLERGASLDDILPEAFAVVREASLRTLGMRHFDVQLLGGIVLHSGKIAEMKTGEGKTLCATLPIYLNALSGKGVHLVTVNDYLARRDAEWMGQVYNFLGLEVGVVLNGLDHLERQKAYGADITYGQNNEFGFDYLRDNMKLELAEKAQRLHNYAIVDEVDSILIDESRTPLIISGPTNDLTELYLVANKIVPRLKEGEHFEIDAKSKQITLQDAGVSQVEKLLEIDNLYDPKHIDLLHHTNQALKAHNTMKVDIDYVVRGGEVIIVDEFTGRLMSGRRWSDGLHQAVEAKEGVAIQRENQTLATITFQNYFRMYKKLSGMTGTADTEAVEFKKIYNLDVIVMPTNQAIKRIDNADVVYATKRGKFKAVCDEIEELHKKGQPMLVGTASIATSEEVSELLNKRGVPHNVLNAKHHEREAEIVAQAGRLGGITIATNMAGRGTDILLGGNPEFLAAAEFEKDELENPENTSEYARILEEYKKECEEEKKKVIALGGLHILGTERHESRRIDNQLRGRSGRQGDPGSSRFYVSLEDELMKRFGGERMQAIMLRMGMSEEDALQGRMVASAIENAQKKVEGFHFDIRKHLLEYDDVMNKQRQVIYKVREEALNGETVRETIEQMIPETLEDLILAHVKEKEAPIRWDTAAILRDFNRQFAFNIPENLFDEKKETANLKTFAQEIYDFLKNKVLTAIDKKKKDFGEENFNKLTRIVYLQSIDHFWKDHLSQMDHLKEGIYLRSYNQKNPLHEYQQEGYEMFAATLLEIKASVLQNIFYAQALSEEELRQIEEREKAELRRLEEQAQSLHREFGAEEKKPEGGDGNTQGMNRKQRRKVEKRAAGGGVGKSKKHSRGA